MNVNLNKRLHLKARGKTCLDTVEIEKVYKSRETNEVQNKGSFIRREREFVLVPYNLNDLNMLYNFNAVE